MPTASHTVHRPAATPVERLFDTVVAEDVLPKVLHRWGPIPGVVGMRDLNGPWDTPGSERTVVLGDGSTARERVLMWERPTLFEYRVDRLTGPFGRLVDHAIGSWVFASAGEGASSFSWTYTFHARGLAAGAILGVVAKTAWARYMAQCADACVRLASAS
jgi:Polyketide cyclase / dehydrase and lipid transport